MFKNNNNNASSNAETIIGPSIKVKGNFHGDGNIIIEGMVEGSVKTNSFLLVSSKAKILADIKAKDAKIGGEINGNIRVEGYLEILSTAKIFGDVEAALISIEKGAILNGKCLMTKNKPENKEVIK